MVPRSAGSVAARRHRSPPPWRRTRRRPRPAPGAAGPTNTARTGQHHAHQPQPRAGGATAPRGRRVALTPRRRGGVGRGRRRAPDGRRRAGCAARRGRPLGGHSSTSPGARPTRADRPGRRVPGRRRPGPPRTTGRRLARARRSPAGGRARSGVRWTPARPGFVAPRAVRRGRGPAFGVERRGARAAVAGVGRPRTLPSGSRNAGSPPGTMPSSGPALQRRARVAVDSCWSCCCSSV